MRFIAIALLVAALPCAAEMYKWVDENGKTQYSDQPPPDNAKKSGTLKMDPSASQAPAASTNPKSWQEKDREFNQRRVACKDAYLTLEQMKNAKNTVFVINGITYTPADAAIAQSRVEAWCHGLERSSY